MSIIKKDYGHGGANSDEMHGGSEYPQIATVLRDVATDVAGLNPGTPAWSANTAVASHTVTLTTAGLITNVYAAVGSAVGPKALVPTGVTPAAGQARVVYSASGIPTILFATADAVTSANFQQIKRPASFTVKTIAG